jgi:hypothetical protein
VKSDWKRSEGKAGSLKHTASNILEILMTKVLLSQPSVVPYLIVDADGLFASQITSCLG